MFSKAVIILINRALFPSRATVSCAHTHRYDFSSSVSCCNASSGGLNYSCFVGRSVFEYGLFFAEHITSNVSATMYVKTVKDTNNK